MSAGAIAAEDDVFRLDALFINEKPETGHRLDQLARVLMLGAEGILQEDDLLRFACRRAAHHEWYMSPGADGIVVSTAVGVKYGGPIGLWCGSCYEMQHRGWDIALTVKTSAIQTDGSMVQVLSSTVFSDPGACQRRAGAGLLLLRESGSRRLQVGEGKLLAPVKRRNFTMRYAF